MTRFILYVAFRKKGTGHNETTHSCLVRIGKSVGKIVKGRFLDLGTGTGLLAIAESKLDFQDVVAIDTDPLAIEGAYKNCALNNVGNVTIRSGGIMDSNGHF